MDVSFTAEHEELRQTVRRFLEKESTEAAVRAAMETERGYDTRVWERLASEMALPGLAVAEASGGAGFGPVELAIVMEEMGRVLFCGPYLSTAVLAVGALNAVSKESAVLGEIAAGKLIATLATGEGRNGLTATKDGNAWRIDGVAAFVPDGHVADVILVAARDGNGLGLLRVD